MSCDKEYICVSCGQTYAEDEPYQCSKCGENICSKCGGEIVTGEKYEKAMQDMYEDV